MNQGNNKEHFTKISISSPTSDTSCKGKEKKTTKIKE